MKTTIALCIVIAVSGCASIGDGILTAGTTGDVRFSPADVDVAIQIAVESKDATAEACYRAIRKHVDPEVRTKPVGVVSKYASLRATVREARAGLAAEVHQACSPLIIDAGTFSSQFARKIGGAATPW